MIARTVRRMAELLPLVLTFLAETGCSAYLPAGSIDLARASARFKMSAVLLLVMALKAKSLISVILEYPGVSAGSDARTASSHATP